MPGLYVRDTGGVARKYRELHEAQGGVDRKLREVYARDTQGVSRRVFSAGAHLAGTPTFVSNRTQFDWIDKRYVIDSSGLTADISIVFGAGDWDWRRFGVIIPLDLGTTESFTSGAACLRNEVKLSASAIRPDGWGTNEAPGEYNLALNTSASIDSLATSVMSAERVYDSHSGKISYTIGSYQTLHFLSSVSAQKVYLFSGAYKSDVLTYGDFHLGLHFYIPHEALTIIGSSGQEYPIRFD